MGSFEKTRTVSFSIISKQDFNQNIEDALPS